MLLVKILKSERERFGSITNFVSKTNMFDFFGDVSRKTKANDLEKHWFNITKYQFQEFIQNGNDVCNILNICYTYIDERHTLLYITLITWHKKEKNSNQMVFKYRRISLENQKQFLNEEETSLKINRNEFS